jgi:hypothetical protein
VQGFVKSAWHNWIFSNEYHEVVLMKRAVLIVTLSRIIQSCNADALLNQQKG